MGNLKKSKSINNILFNYIFKIIISSIFIILVLVFLINEGFNRELIYPANYVESKISENLELYETKEIIETADIPAYTGFAVVDENLNYKYGNISKEKYNEIKDTLDKGHTRDSYSGFLKVIDRKDEKLILNYYIKIRFKNPKIDRLFPSVERDVLILGFFLIILNILFLIIKFTRKIGNSILSLKDISREIEKENLDFDIKYTEIKEVNQVAKSMEDMRDELRRSLERQWSGEQEKREQISSLAHDLKTPLTIIKGNVQLLDELEEDLEKQEYIKYMDKNIEDMEKYIKTLINISKNFSEINYDKEYENIDIDKLLDELLDKAKALALRKNIEIINNFSKVEGNRIFASREEIIRIYENILSNAVDFSPVDSQIYLNSSIQGGEFRFTVVDSGRGFSKESLKKAAEEFYMDDMSRGRKNHYGMGLFITKKLVGKYGGDLEIGNTASGNGKVSIIIPIKSNKLKNN